MGIDSAICYESRTYKHYKLFTYSQIRVISLIMKKFVFLLALVVLGTLSYGQKAKINAVTVDTLQGNETVNFAIGKITGDYTTLTIQALCTQLGGTSDGTLTVYGSVDGTSYSFINTVGAETLTASPKASITGADLNQITITDALVASWVIKDTPYLYYRVVGGGTANDTTKITIHYTYK